MSALRDAADEAAAAGLNIGLEYHGDTLTDSLKTTLELLDDIDRPNVGTYWQPPIGLPADEALDELRALIDRVCAVHVFSWWPTNERHALEAREDLWRGALELLGTTGRDYDLFLEFLPQDDVSLLADESRQLRNSITSLSA